jgi:NAD-dependent SIR2 family protein deacetylase
MWRDRLTGRMRKDHILAHKHSIKHRGELEKSSLCGCFHCLAIFPPSDIVEWIDEGQTALCPKCPVDSVIGSASGYPVTTEFLKRMNDHWF